MPIIVGKGKAKLQGHIDGVTVKKADQPLLVQELVSILQNNFHPKAVVILGDGYPARGCDIIHPGTTKDRMFIQRNPRNKL